jgi:general secretion pathway protein F
MPQFRYRALTEGGEVVSGLISAPTAAEVARRIDYLRLVPIDTIIEDTPAHASWLSFKFEQRARPEDVTIFTLDLALLLKAGARLDDALELLASDIDIGRLRSTAGAIRSSVLSGESFADALAQHPDQFPPMYVALVRVGEASGTLEHILQVLARERGRAEALRRKLTDALRYPAFVLFAAICVLIFFLMFVLPQFGAVLHDFGAKIDPIAGAFIRVSEIVTEHKDLVGFALVAVLACGFLVLRQPTGSSHPFPTRTLTAGSDPVSFIGRLVLPQSRSSSRGGALTRSLLHSRRYDGNHWQCCRLGPRRRARSTRRQIVRGACRDRDVARDGGANAAPRR